MQRETHCKALHLVHWANHTTLLRVVDQPNPAAQQLNLAFHGALLVRAFSLSISGTSVCSHFSVVRSEKRNRRCILVHADKKHGFVELQPKRHRIAHTNNQFFGNMKVYIFNRARGNRAAYPFTDMGTIYIYIYMCVHAHTRMHNNMPISYYIRIYPHISKKQITTHTCIYIYMYVHICTHKYIYIYK